MAIPAIRMARTADLSAQILEELRFLNEEAFGQPFVEDWDHALGGTHFFIEEGGAPVSHAAVVERILEADGHSLRTGYVEAVATLPPRQHHGLATSILRAVNDHIRADFELGALSTGSPGFYERLGWTRWRGLTGVRTDGGLVRTEDDDGSIMVLRTGSTPELDLDATIVCQWRIGDVW